jgi:CAAX protease family protein
MVLSWPGSSYHREWAVPPRRKQPKDDSATRRNRTMTDVEARRDAMRKIGLYLLLTFALSSIFWVLIIRGGSLLTRGGLYVLLLMWSPGTAAILTRLVLQRNLRGMGWGWGRTRWQLMGYLLPILYASVVYLVVWYTGLGSPGGPRPGGVWGFVVLGSILSVRSAAGEEIGWRGLLVPELSKVTGFTSTALLSGIAWTAWHVPLIVLADYNGGTPAWYSTLCFAVMVVGISFPMAWLRLRSGSLWAAALFHASHNLYIQGYFDRATLDTGITKWITGEFGAALAIMGILLAVIFWLLRKRVGGGASSSAVTPEPAAA